MTLIIPVVDVSLSNILWIVSDSPESTVSCPKALECHLGYSMGILFLNSVMISLIIIKIYIDWLLWGKNENNWYNYICYRL